jgi:hypothetical protein
LIRLRSQPWTPSQVSASPDQRSLGIRFSSAVIAP